MSDNKVSEFAKQIGEQIPDWSQDGKALAVYNIPIDKLYYNDDNGRIATWISIYNDTPNNTPLSELDREEYNNVIHEIIIKSNTTASYKKTLQDVKVKGQINPGVVLADGRIVSGNRRFTVLRDLYNDTGNEKFRFFKCFIVDKDIINESDRKDIKTIERLTQFGVDEKVDYDPIDRLVDIYNDLVGPNKMWTIDEYSKKLALKKNDVLKMYYKALVMADYLAYINKPNKFYIAKNKKLDGPLQEIGKLYHKIDNPQEWNRIRAVFYSHFEKDGDRTRNIRPLVQIYNKNSRKFDEILVSVNADIEKREIELIQNSTNLESDESKKSEKNIANETSSTPDSLAVPLTEDTEKIIYKVVQETKIDTKKKEKISKLIDAIDVILLNLEDTFDMADQVEKENIKRRVSLLLKKLKEFEGM